MGLTATLSSPLYTGVSAVAGDVPAVFPAALAGRRYLLDLNQYRRESIPVIRQQADQSGEPSERSFNPYGLWRRGTESWHKGAGQSYLDLDDSDRARFRASKGIDPWTPGELKLLGSTTRKRTSANTNLRLAIAGSRLYVADGNALAYTADLSSFTTVTGVTAAAVTAITTDGYRVWTAHGTSDVDVTNTGTGAASAFSTVDTTLLAYCNGRLIGAHGPDLFELDNLGGLVGTGLFTHPTGSGWTWDVIAAAPNAIYACGHAGTNGEIYRIAVTNTGAALAAPIAAAALPDGEYVASLAAYVGVVVLGTNRGVRLASVDATGNLNYGPLVALTGGAVYCLEGEDRFVWFGWSNFDGSSTGLGRCDLSQFTGTLRPAYASDLMAATQGTVQSAATFLAKRVFTVSGSGVWSEDTAPVATGYADSGVIRWGTTESKTVHSIDLRTVPLPSGAAVQVALSLDSDTFEVLGTLSGTTATRPGEPFSARLTRAEQAEVRVTLTAASATPTLTRHTTKALVTPARSERIQVPIVLREQVEPNDVTEVRQDTAAEFRFLKSLETAGLPVTYQEGNEAWQVTVEGVTFTAEPSVSWTAGRAWLNGTLLVTLQTIEG